MLIGKTLRLSLAGLAAGTVALGAMAAQAATNWDMSVVWPEGNFHTQNALEFAEKVKEATGGEVNITVHPGGALGIKGPEGMVAVQDGLVPIADILLNQQVGEAPFLGIESVPYLAPSADELKILQKHARPVYEDIAKTYNQKILYIVPWPGQALYAKRPVNTKEQIQGLKMRVVDKNGHEFFSKLGAAPLQLPWGEVVPALAAGTIEGVTTSSSSGVDGKFWEFLGHMNRLNWQSASNMVNVNLDAWNALEPKHRTAIETLAEEMEPEFWARSRQEDESKLKILAGNGIEITTPSPELKAELLETAEPMWADFMARVPEAKAVIDAYRADQGKN